METTTAGWNVLDQDAAVLTHNYEFTKGASSTTFVAKMQSGELLVISPSIGLTDAMADELQTFGKVGAIVANNGFHYLGQAQWRDRFPQARRFAAPEAIARITKKSKAKLDFEPIAALQELTGPDMHVREVPNTKLGETWCSVKTASGYAWYVSDVLNNMPELPSSFFPRLLFKLTKSGPGFTVFHLALKFMVKDRKATLRLLLEDMQAHEPTVIVPAHGNMLSQPGLAADARAVVEAAL